MFPSTTPCTTQLLMSFATEMRTDVKVEETRLSVVYRLINTHIESTHPEWL